MQAPQISVRDIIDAVRQTKEIYDAFCHKHKNARKRYATFQAELERVETSLQIEWTEEQYPGARAFKDLLEECNDYMEDKKELTQESPKAKRSFRLVQQTVTSTFDREMPRLKQDLHYRRLELSDWKLNLLLKHVFQPIRLSEVSTGPSTLNAERSIDRNSTTSQPIADEVQEACSELIPPFLDYKELVESSAEDHHGNNNAATIDRLNANLRTILSTICRLANFPDDYRPPNMTLERVDELIDEKSHQDLHIGLRSQSALRMSFPRYCRIHIFVPKHKRKPLQADSYITVGRRCIFHNDKRQVVFEHRLPRECRPNTFHRKFDHPHTVDFVGEQDVSVFELSSKSLPSRETLLKASIEYVFITDEERRQASKGDSDQKTRLREQEQNALQDRMRFQSDLRRKELMHEFHVSRVFSKKSDKIEDSNDVCVKLWHDAVEPYLTTLSFPGMFESSKLDKRRFMYEWPLRWFDVKVGKKDKRAVMLEFLTDQSRGASVSSIATSNSGGSTGSSVRSLPVGDISNPFAPPWWINEIAFLKFELDSCEESTEFVEAIREARKVDGQPPLNFSQPPSELVPLSTPSSSAWTPLSPLSIRNRPTTSSRTTVGTSPMSPNSREEVISQKPPPRIPDLKLGASSLMETSPILSTNGNSEHHYAGLGIDLPSVTTSDSARGHSVRTYSPSDILQDVGLKNVN